MALCEEIALFSDVYNAQPSVLLKPAARMFHLLPRTNRQGDDRGVHVVKQHTEAMNALFVPMEHL